MGRKNRMEVIDVLSKSKVGVNYTPDIYPFNIQTSTKVLEYIAAGLDVISNKYEWINNFEKESGFNFLDIKELESDNFIFRENKFLSSYIKSWNEIFDSTKIIQIIEKI